MDPIAELEKRIQESKQLIAEQESALAVLKKAFGGIGTTAVVSATKPAINKNFSFGDLVVPPMKRNVLTDQIQSVVGTFGTNEFTVLHVEAALQQLGTPVNGKSPRARISLSLAKLLDDKFVEKVFEGSGNVPHRYRLKGESPASTGLSGVTMSLAG